MLDDLEFRPDRNTYCGISCHRVSVKYSKELMGKFFHPSLFLVNKDMYENFKPFDFWHVQTADIRVTTPEKKTTSALLFESYIQNIYDNFTC